MVLLSMMRMSVSRLASGSGVEELRVKGRSLQVSNAFKNFTPFFDRVVVERLAAETKTKGGIMIPEKAQGKVLEATVGELICGWIYCGAIHPSLPRSFSG